MLKLLLDEHISPKVARALRQHVSEIVVWQMNEWERGGFLGQPDAVCLEAAAQQNLTFVTYDCKTIPPLLKVWGAEGRNHAGVILVDEKTIASEDIGGLLRALLELFNEAREWDWTNRVHVL